MTFHAGISGNPNGRPKGSGSRQQVFNMLVGPHKDALINKAVDLALDGNEAMLRLLLDRILPAKPTDEPIQIDMPDTCDFNSTKTISSLGFQSLKAVISGEITPGDAKKISALVGVHYKMFQIIELVEELRVLKEMKR